MQITVNFFGRNWVIDDAKLLDFLTRNAVQEPPKQVKEVVNERPDDRFILNG